MEENFDVTLTFKDFEDGSDMQKELCKLKRKKGYVTYRDFLRMGDVRINYPKIYDDYGWTDLIGMTLELNYETMEYVLKMPTIINLTQNKERK